MSIFLRRRPGYSVFSQVCFGEGQRTRLETSNYWFVPANMKMLDCVLFIAAFSVQFMKFMIVHHFTSGLGSSESWCWVQAIVTEYAEAHLSWPTLPLCRLPPNLPPLSPPHGIPHYKWALFIVWMFYSLRSPFIPRRGAQCKLGFSQCAVISEPMLNVCWVHVALKYTF